MSASMGLTANRNQRAGTAIFFLLLATLALQISWVLPLFGVAQTPAARHLVRMAIKWSLFVVFLRMMRSRTMGLAWRELGVRYDGWRDVARQLGLAVVLTAPLGVLFAASPTLQDLVLLNLSPPDAPGLGSGAAGTIPQSVGLLFGIVAVAFTAAFLEELFWRGYALARRGGLPARFGIRGAVAIASALFGLTHTYLGWTAVVLTFGGGIALSLVYWWRRSLLLNIAIHFLFDVAGPLYVLSK